MFSSIYCFTLFNALLFYLSSGKNNIENRYLSVAFLLLAIRGLSFIPTMNELHPILQIFFFHNFLPFNFLLGPVLYFYFRFQTRGIHFSLKRDYVHLLVFGISLLNMIPFYASSLESKKMLLSQALQQFTQIFKLDLFIFNSSIYYLVPPLYTISYMVLSLNLLMRHSKYVYKNLVDKSKKTLKNWLTNTFGCFLAIIWINFILTYYAYINEDNTRYSIFLITVLILIYLNIQVYSFPQILYGIKFTQNLDERPIILINKSKKNILIDEIFITKFEETIQGYHKTLDYLSPKFDIYQLAKDTNYPTYVLIFYFKSNLNCQFADFKNRLRIEYFLRSFEPSELNQFTLIHIVKRYGYSNLVSFKKAFHQIHQEEFSKFLLKQSN